MIGWLRLARICRTASLFLALFAAPTALAAEQPSEACPSRVAVLRALRALSAKDVRGVPATLDDALDLHTQDSGDVYRVTVNGRTRSYTDAHRDCAERAQVAAVFAALVLSSPNAVDAEPEPEPARAAPAPPPAAAPPANRATVLAFHPRRWWFDAGIALALAPGIEGPPLEPVAEASAHLRRVPIDAGARWVLHALPFVGTLDAGAVLALLRLRQAEDSGTSTQSRVELGFHLATRWQLAKPVISPYFELFSEVIPVRYPLALEPTGVLAKNSRTLARRGAGRVRALRLKIREPPCPLPTCRSRS